MPNSPVVTARKFGRWLQLQRGDRSREQVALKVRPLLEPVGLKVDQSLIQRIEQGRVPSWPLLAALCRVYKVDIRRAVLQLIETLEFPGSAGLLCPPEGVDLASNQLPRSQEGGGTDDNTAAAARSLAQDLLLATDAFLGAVQEITDRFPGGLAPAGSPSSTPRPRHRATDPVHSRRKLG